MKTLRLNLRMMTRIAFVFVILGVLGFGLAACNMTLAGGSTSTETGDKISLSGRVTGGSGEPVSGVVVSLKTSGISDTTDSVGSYRLTGRTPAGVTTDTLRFTLHGQLIEQQAVSVFELILPDTRIIQRGFAGALDAYDVTVTRIEGVLTGDDIEPGDSVAADFFFNALAGDQSGFMWFPPAMGRIRHYVIHINVYGDGDMRIGRSMDVPFTSQAGNVTIPRFHADNLVQPGGGPGE